MSLASCYLCHGLRSGAKGFSGPVAVIDGEGQEEAEGEGGDGDDEV